MNFGEFWKGLQKSESLDAWTRGFTLSPREEEQDWRVPTRSKASAFLVGGLRMLERYVSVR